MAALDRGSARAGGAPHRRQPALWSMTAVSVGAASVPQVRGGARCTRRGKTPPRERIYFGSSVRP